MTTATKEAAMTDNQLPEPPERPWVEVTSRLCKGCDFCVQACPPDVLGFSTDINERGYRYSYYLGEGCTGCGICFYNCPEPGAIVVWRKKTDKKERKVLQ
jgi:NAD-dependent dihydropyrimidine dehydrogenase PreA subunit